MARLFEGTFEIGDLSEFAAQFVKNGEIGVIQFPYVGAYAGYAKTNPTLEQAYATVGINVDRGEVFARGYFYVNQGIEALLTNDRFYMLRFFGADNQRILEAGIRREWEDPAKWCLWLRGPRGPDGNWTGGHRYGTVVQPTPRWVCVEVHYSRFTGLYEVWIDNKLEITATADTLEHPNVTRVEFGIFKTGLEGQPYDPTGEYTIEVYFDNTILAEEYIGPEPPQPPPPDCYTNADCAEGEICVEGKCVEAPPECYTDADCPEGQVCEEGKCVEGPEPPPKTVWGQPFQPFPMVITKLRIIRDKLVRKYVHEKIHPWL